MSTVRAELPPFVDLVVVPLINVVIAFLVSGLVVAAIGESPLEAVAIMIRGALGWAEGIGFTLYYTTNFVFTGLAVAVAFRAGLFNIGGEGQAMLGGLGVALVCLRFDGAPWWLVAPFAVGAAMLFGAAWAYVPAWAQARRGSHVVITTIMFNYLAATLMVWLLVDVMGKPGSMTPESRSFAEATRLPTLDALAQPFGLHLGASPLNPMVFVAVGAVGFVWLLLFRTRLGFEIRTVGRNREAAIYAGIDPGHVVIVAMLLSGALAGLMAVNEVMATQHRLLLDFTAGAGFVGIAVALMGRAHPLGVIPAALLFGVLYQGGAELAFERPRIGRDMIVVIQALVILFAGALEHMARPALARMFARGADAEGAA